LNSTVIDRHGPTGLIPVDGEALDIAPTTERET
jgi:hypothetical protein